MRMEWALRLLGDNGQSSDPQLPSYIEDGLPLIPELIELITQESSTVGGRHEHLADHEEEIAIYAWAGEPEDSHNEVGGVDWILAAGTGDPDSVFYIIPEAVSSEFDSTVTVLSKSGLVQGIEIFGTVSQGKQLVVDFTLEVDEPTIVLATGEGSSLQGGSLDTQLKVFEWSGDVWSVVDENRNWSDHDKSSLGEALLLRGNADSEFAETETSLPLVLGSGRYRVTLESAVEPGESRLRITGLNWRK